MKVLLATAISVGTTLGACSSEQEMPHVRPSEETLVHKALDIYREGKVSRAELLKTYDPVVVYLPKMTCVGLNLKDDSFGGDQTMCFDRSGKQVVSYLNGQ
ncbi:MAG: hypothetical protein M3Q52_06670 [Pseudomonadota bacterium]|nr:hypothetical protein [Pseudomonadota bacterium]